jgi:pimeloyl-ACP methyl ester carboxylesterase
MMSNDRVHAGRKCHGKRVCRAGWIVFLVCLGGSWKAVHADIHDLTYASALNGQQIPVKVYLPPGYESGTQRYPVIYNLHGGGGSPQRQWDRTRRTLTAAMESRAVRPMIYVYCNGLGNTEFVNTADGRLIERSLIEELIPFIDSRFRTIASREGRAVDGFSMGGFGCLMLAFRHPDRFAAVVSYGAALDLPGGNQMKHLRRLIESRPFLSRIPDDDTVLNSPKGEGAERIQVTRDKDRTWAMYYLTSGQTFQANLANLKGPKIQAWWFNPRDGLTYGNDGIRSDRPFAEFINTDNKPKFDPPGESGEDHDWVLVLDCASSGYPVPGSIQTPAPSAPRP